jgi:hypothetical protein
VIFRLELVTVPVSEVQSYPWGRFCLFSDPDRNTWSVHEPPA